MHDLIDIVVRGENNSPSSRLPECSRVCLQETFFNPMYWDKGFVYMNKQIYEHDDKELKDGIVAINCLKSRVFLIKIENDHRLCFWLIMRNDLPAESNEKKYLMIPNKNTGVPKELIAEWIKFILDKLIKIN